MPSLLPTVTFAALIPGYTTIDQKTITIWAQVTISAGVYLVGGIPFGLVSLARSLTIDDATFLAARVVSEKQVPFTGTYFNYRYYPTTDYLQIFQQTTSSGVVTATTELTASAIIPSGVINDTIVVEAVYNRL